MWPSCAENRASRASCCIRGAFPGLLPRCHCARAGTGLAESRDLCAGSLQIIHFKRLLRQRFFQLKVLLAKPLFGTRSLLLFVSMPAMVSHPCRDETASWMGHLEFQKCGERVDHLLPFITTRCGRARRRVRAARRAGLWRWGCVSGSRRRKSHKAGCRDERASRASWMRLWRRRG